MLTLLAQFKIPGSTSSPLPVPSGIPKELSGGLKSSGAKLIQTGYQYIFLTAIVLAVLFIIYSGIQMIQSGGDSQKLAEARSRLIYALIGLGIVILAFVIISGVITAVGGKPSLFFGRR